MTGPKVLVVDDYPDNLEALVRFLALKSPDWEIFKATSPSAALEILEKQAAIHEPITVMLTDLRFDMTDNTNTEGLRIIEKARDVAPGLLSILYSSMTDLDRNRAFDLGAFDVVEKNQRGIASAREIHLKTLAAIRHRESSERISFLSRFFDRRVIKTIEENRSLLKVQPRTVTICFWDIQGFSRLCRELKSRPVLLADFLKEYCDEAAKTIFANGGIVDKFMGDGVMALFGVLDSTEHADHGALAAVTAAVTLRREFEVLVRRCMKQWNLPADGRTLSVGLRCGIHTGEALVGCAGTDFRDQFTALGESVNLAARFEAEADGTQRQILVSNSTKNLVDDAVSLTFVKEIPNVKNIDGPFKLFAVNP